MKKNTPINVFRFGSALRAKKVSEEQRKPEFSSNIQLIAKNQTVNSDFEIANEIVNGVFSTVSSNFKFCLLLTELMYLRSSFEQRNLFNVVNFVNAKTCGKQSEKCNYIHEEFFFKPLNYHKLASNEVRGESTQSEHFVVKNYHKANQCETDTFHFFLLLTYNSSNPSNTSNTSNHKPKTIF